MSNEGTALGRALMEENARRATARISYATFTCVVEGKNIHDLGIEAWKACAAYFDEQAFDIESLDAEGEKAATGGDWFYRARVRARAI